MIFFDTHIPACNVHITCFVPNEQATKYQTSMSEHSFLFLHFTSVTGVNIQLRAENNLYFKTTITLKTYRSPRQGLYMVLFLVVYI